jgi:holliday junction DNA helicase RuvA
VIGFLRGRLVAKSPPSLVLDVNGVGYELDAPMTTFYQLPEIGQEVHLFTHLVVREDAHVLFGFSRQADRALFRSLIKVNGVGARLALTLLSGLGVDEFYRCVRDHDTASLVRLPGIGKKTAERLIIEMRDRLPANELGGLRNPLEAPIEDDEFSPAREAMSALIALGYKNQDAHRMVKKVPLEGKTSEEIIRSALQSAG